MSLKINIVLLVCIPIISVFIGAFISQYIALLYMHDQIQSYSQELYNQQILFSKQFTSIMSFQLNRKMQVAPFCLFAVNSFVSKIFQEKVIFNKNHVRALVHPVLLFQQNDDPILMKLYRENYLYTTAWYHQNSTSINGLDSKAQQLILNMYKLTPLMRAIQNENKFNPGQSTNYLPLNQVGFGFEFEGLMFMNFLNSSMSKVDVPGCQKGNFIYDPRCKLWYLDASKFLSFSILEPRITITPPQAHISQQECQRVRFYNSTTKKNELKHIVCLDVILSTLDDLFSNVVKSTKQYYIIDPRSQSIIYNSKKDFSFDQLQIDNFSDLELQFLQSQDDAKLLNDTINANYNTWQLGQLPYANTTDFFNYTQQYKQIPYNRNGTQHQVILNPIVIQDRIPYYISEVEKVYGTQMSLAYLQINMISNEDLQQQSQDLLQLQYLIQLIVSIALLVLSIISIFISIYYALQIFNLVQQPISHLCSILKKIHRQNKHCDMQQILQQYENRATDIFLSHETKELYESFYQVFQILLYTSENFFQENESKTLIRLSKEIEFLQQFQNYHAIGITHNNIGCLLLNQQHYFQALEHFSQSIIYARYQIEQFCLSKPDSIYSSILKEFCYSDKVIGSKQKKVNIESIELMTSFFQKNQKLHFQSVQNQISLEKTNNNEKQDNTFLKKMQANRNQQQQRSTRDCPVQQEKRLSDKNNNQDSSICNQSTHKYPSVHSNIEEIKNQFNQQLLDEQEQERNQVVHLLSRIFYRKQNYVITLIQFQEQIDFQQNKQKSLTKKNAFQSIKNLNSASNHTQDIKSYNFWYEIKKLLKDLNQVSKLMISPDFQKISVYSYLAKTYYNLNQFRKSQQILRESQQIFQNFLQKCKNQSQKQQTRRISSNKFQNKNQPSPKIQKIREQNHSLPSKFSEVENRQNKSYTITTKKIQQNQHREQQQYKGNYISIKNQNNENKSQEKNIFSPRQNSQYIFNFNSEVNSNIYSNHKLNLNEIQSPNVSINYNQNAQNTTQKNEIDQQNLIHSPAKKQDKSFSMNVQRDKLILLEENNSLEQIFQNQRKQNSLQKQLNELKNYQIIQCEQLKLQINFIRAEYFIKINDFKKAAEILTFILEDNFIIMSHFPYKIIYKLKSIFDMCNIHSPDLDQIFSKFNKDLFFKVGIIFNNLREDQQNVKTLQLISNLVNDVLNKKEDQLGIILFDSYQKSICQYMDLNKTIFIKPIINRIILDIQNQFSVSKFLSLDQQAISFTSNKSYTDYVYKNENNKLVSPITQLIPQEDLEYLELSQECDDNSSTNQKRINCNNVDSQQIGKIYTQEFKLLKNQSRSKQKSKDKQIIQLNGDISGVQELKSQEFYENWFSDSIEEEQTQQMKQNQFLNMNQVLSTQNILNSPKSDINLIDNQINEKYCAENKQILQIQQESTNKIILDMNQQVIKKTYCEQKYFKNEKSLDNFQNKNILITPQNVVNIQDKIYDEDIIDRNTAFHLSIRKSILQFFNQTFQVQTNKFEEYMKYFKQNQFNQLAQQEYLQNQNQKNNKFKRILIYCTDLIEIKDNNIFKQLCNLLANNKLQIVIFSEQRGDNFLEKLQNKTLNYQNQEIIKIFYSISSVKKYLQSSRDSFCKNTESIIIEHF
ncbi:hypothetical protein ABPG74_020463 [Tetrahymena malaccensis]